MQQWQEPDGFWAMESVMAFHLLIHWSVKSQNFHTEKCQKQSFLYINVGIFEILTKKNLHTLNIQAFIRFDSLWFWNH